MDDSGRSLADAMTASLLEGRLTDPFAFLGPQGDGDRRFVRTFQPGAEGVDLLIDDQPPQTLQETAPGLFTGRLPATAYRLRIAWPGGIQETEDPYAFGLLLGEMDLHLFSEGSHWRLAHQMGAHPTEMDGVAGVGFSVWAPNARRVSVVGDFNSWDGRRHPMRLRHAAGVWELFVPRLGPADRP